jgi:hypothetical protein
VTGDAERERRDAELRAAADRIRRQVAEARCRCELPPVELEQGRCARCIGRVDTATRSGRGARRAVY